MSEEKKWDIYYCADSETAQEPAASDPKQVQAPDSSASAAAEDILISKAAHHQTPPNEKHADDHAKKPGFWHRNNSRNLKILIVVLLIVLLAMVTVFILFVRQKLNLIDYDSGRNFEHANETQVIEEDPLFTPMHDVTDASSLKDWLQKWALNGGEKMYSKNVVNCLLCGVDTEEGSDGRTDAMILVSVNKKTKKISLTSFMRDCYTYMNIDGNDRWYKINSAYNWGGAATLVETIENNYKIRIDNYITVDFDTFPKMINALGGVNVKVEEYEAKYIRRTSSHKKFPYGENVKLNGDQALIYSRIRHSDADGDLSRTRRQRKLVTALMQKARSASIGQLTNLMNTVLPYVQTNYRPPQILSLATQALMQSWINYEIVQISCPLLAETEEEPAVTGKDSYMMTGYGYNPEFVWVVDYQMDAQRVQNALYGKSNIEIRDESRESPFNFLSGGRVTDSRSYNSYTTTRSAYVYDSNENSDTPENEEPESTTRLLDRFLNPFTSTQPSGDNAPDTENEEPYADPAPADDGQNSFDAEESYEN